MVIFFSFLAVAFTLTGAGIVLKFGGLSKRALGRALAYAAGVLICAALLDIVPAGFALSPSALSYGMLAVLLTIFTLENFAAHSSCSEYLEDCEVHHIGAVAIAAMGLHSLLDGFNIAVGFAPGTVAGINVALGVILHKFADGVTLVSLLLHAGNTRRKALVFSLWLAAATPAGALVAAPLLKGLPPGSEAFMLGLSGGSFLYIAMADILPRLHKTYDRLAPAIFALGFATVWLIRRFGA
ncbi:MAG TPA: ZIP family metal transporter [Elusimicrobiales bacterium]|nr:ZIP family metal transporter [Elusimicrobiales bacterium]